MSESLWIAVKILAIIDWLIVDTLIVLKNKNDVSYPFSQGLYEKGQVNPQNLAWERPYFTGGRKKLLEIVSAENYLCGF